jgi:hypothetical protein
MLMLILRFQESAGEHKRFHTSEQLTNSRPDTRSVHTDFSVARKDRLKGGIGRAALPLLELHPEGHSNNPSDFSKSTTSRV